MIRVYLKKINTEKQHFLGMEKEGKKKKKVFFSKETVSKSSKNFLQLATHPALTHWVTQARYKELAAVGRHST